MGSLTPRASSLLLFISDVNTLNSFLQLSKRSRAAYALFSQLGARARSRDTQSTRKGPACRFRLVPTSLPSSSFGTDLNCSQPLSPPLWCVDPCCHGLNQNVIKRGLNEIFRRPVIWVHCSPFLLCSLEDSYRKGDEYKSTSIGRALAEQWGIQVLLCLMSFFICLQIGC